jgi:hypothetical protein
MERRLAEFRPDLLPQAADYETVLRAGLDHDHQDSPTPRRAGSRS